MTTLVTRVEAASILGYSPRTLATYMSRDPQNWPAPVSKRRQGRVWVNLYGLDEMLRVARPAHAPRTTPVGHAISITDEDGLLTCLYCGRRARNLVPHLIHDHHTTATEYRDEHQLPATAALIADSVREEAHDRQVQRLTDDPAMLDHLDPWRTTEWTTRIAHEAAESIRATTDRPLVRQGHAAARRAAVEAMEAAKARRREDRVRAHGYASVTEAIDATRSLSERRAARAIGLSASTVHRLRHNNR